MSGSGERVVEGHGAHAAVAGHLGDVGGGLDPDEYCKERGAEGFIRIKNLLWSAMERIDVLRASGGDITGVPSGFADLDRMTLGFQRSDLIVVAARPSMGKTALVLNIAQNAAIDRNVPVAVYARLKGNRIHIDGLAASADGRRIVRESMEQSLELAEETAIALAERILNLGGREILAEIS